MPFELPKKFQMVDRTQRSLRVIQTLVKRRSLSRFDLNSAGRKTWLRSLIEMKGQRGQLEGRFYEVKVVDVVPNEIRHRSHRGKEIGKCSFELHNQLAGMTNWTYRFELNLEIGGSPL